MMEKNLHQVLKDLEKELSSEFLEGNFNVRGKNYHMRLLTEGETTYSFCMSKATNTITLAMSSRLANLSIGIRSIDGKTIEEMFTPMYNSMNVDDLESYQGDSKQIIMSKLFYNYLINLPPSFISELADCWQSLEKRRMNAKEEIKNSSGETSEKEENEN